MKVCIIGHGFVGKALDFGIDQKLERLLIDPKYDTKISDLENYNPDIIFICVPTPMNDDGSQDISIIDGTLNKITKFSSDTQIIIKSTVLPNYLSDFENKIPNIIYNPEFLRESSANEDFINSDLIIFGGNKKNTMFIENFYRNFTNCKNQNYIHTDIITAAFIKYTINTFLASKVIFFNELFHLFKISGAKDTWENFIEALNHDKRIGNSHMQVPGPDGRFGYGGACFPKDSSAFCEYSKMMKKTMKLLEKSIDINQSIRNQYKVSTKRELDQNISFGEKDID